MTEAEFHLPSPPDPATVAQWTTEVRALIYLLMGAGISMPWLSHITDQQISNYLTAILTILGLLGTLASLAWSHLEKARAAAAARKIAVASAVASAHATELNGVSTPVTVAVVKTTPAGQPDIGEASLIGPSEMALAPKVPRGELPAVASPGS